MILPEVTVRFFNPRIEGTKYLLDLQCKCNKPGKQVFGINVRYFYDGGYFAAVKSPSSVNFVNFKGGYGMGPFSAVVPFAGNAASKVIFGTLGPAVFINSYIQLMNINAAPVVLDNWATIFTVSTTLKSVVDCPVFVLDREYDVTRGGFLPGSDGILVALRAEPGTKNANGVLMETQHCTTLVEQFNWGYNGKITPPFGAKIPCL